MNATALITGALALAILMATMTGAANEWDRESAAREAVGRCYAAGGSAAQCEEAGR